MSTDHTTYAKAYADDACQAVETIANQFTQLASDLRLYAQAFEGTLESDARTGPSSLAADIVSRCTSQVGTVLSTQLWCVTYNAGQAEIHKGKSND